MNQNVYFVEIMILIFSGYSTDNLDFTVAELNHAGCLNHDLVLDVASSTGVVSVEGYDTAHTCGVKTIEHLWLVETDKGVKVKVCESNSSHGVLVVVVAVLKSNLCEDLTL